MTTIGFIGAGHIGSQLARLAVANGYQVVLSNSRGPETLAELVKELGPSACAGTPAEAARAGELVVVTVPLKAYRDVPVEPLAGKIVIDTNNYYPERDGHIRALDDETTTSSELLQAHLPTSKVVKAFNHIHAAHLTQHGQPRGTAGPPCAGDRRGRRRGEGDRGRAHRPVRIRRGRRRAAQRELAHPAGHARLRAAPHGRGAPRRPGGGEAVAVIGTFAVMHALGYTRGGLDPEEPTLRAATSQSARTAAAAAPRWRRGAWRRAPGRGGRRPPAGDR